MVQVQQVYSVFNVIRVVKYISPKTKSKNAKENR